MCGNTDITLMMIIMTSRPVCVCDSDFIAEDIICPQ